MYIRQLKTNDNDDDDDDNDNKNNNDNNMFPVSTYENKQSAN